MIKIVTDSTAGLPEAVIRAHDIHIVPLCVHFGEQAFKEGVDLSNEDFYARLSKASELPTTSQPSAGEFYEVFKKLIDAGHEVVALTISSKLSGTWASAMAAADMLPGAPISIVDSLCTSVAMYLMLDGAMECVAAGATRREVEDLLTQMREKVYVTFVVDTLEYLAKGGRIGNAKAFLGTLLKIKPILVLKDGLIEPLEQVRSKRKALTRMIDLCEERLNGRSAAAKVAIAHAVCPEETALLREETMARFGCAEPTMSEVGAVIGTHTGPGVIAMAVYA